MKTHMSTPNGKRASLGITNPTGLLVLGVLAVGLFSGTTTARIMNSGHLNETRSALAHSVPEVHAMIAKAGDTKTVLELPGDTQPIQDIPIFARVNGYLSKRLVDIGDNVKAGQLLAVIETPEIDHQVEQARANLKVAEANLSAANSDHENLTAQLSASESAIKQARTNLEFSATEIKRYQVLATQGAISFEQRDQVLKQYNSDLAQIQINQQNERALKAQVVSANAKIAAATQAVQSNKEALQQLLASQGFQNVVAPSDGVITNRMVDAGALIAAGGSSGTTQLMTMAKTDVLRIYVDVPQSDYRFIHNGSIADIALQEFPGQVFHGTVTNMAGSFNSNSRTLQTELRIDNHNHVLKPGSFAQVKFAYNNPTPPVIIPSTAAITKNDGLYAGVSVNGKVQYRKLDVARDYGNKLAINTGLRAGETVLLDVPDGINEGSAVKPIVDPIAMK